MNLSPLTRQDRLSHASITAARLLSARTFFPLAFCCLAFVFVVYRQSLDFQFVLDDHRFTADPRIQESGHIWDYFANFVWAQFTGGQPSFYRPVFLLWMRINFVLSALSPWGWHLLSIGKHVLVAALLGMLALKLLRDSTVTLVAATLFALHPAQTESVSWVTVPDPLMAAGVLIALLCYFRYLEGFSNKEPVHRKKPRKSSTADLINRQGKWLAASVAAYFVALLAKETAIVFPVVILALNLRSTPRQMALQDRSRADGGNSGRWTQALRQTLPFIAVTGMYLVLRLGALGGMGAATQHLPWSTVVLSWPAILWFYLRVLLWPRKSYSFADPILIEKFSAREVLLPLLGLACAVVILAALLFWAWRRAQRELEGRAAGGVESAIIVGTLLLVLPLLPALNLNALNPGDFLHGRYTYLPLVGLMLLMAAGWRMTKLPRIVLLCVACALTIAFAALTFGQEKQWKDDATVFGIAHELAPNNVPVARHLADTRVQTALLLDEEGRCSEATPIFEQVIREFPQDWYAWAGLGDCYAQLNDLVKAEESLHRAADISHNPRVTAHWQELRIHMGLSSSAPAN
ncbi:MAG TPA: tetratricopeptide repeat protein [Terriglobales bacterium]|nr:tetratricopeptide repeat protein [Terriglobales bacterium]